MAGKLVTIATFDQAAQAHVARSVLEEAGIRAAVTDEETVAMLWHYSTAVGGIKVQVLEEDADRALAALDRALGPGDSAAAPAGGDEGGPPEGEAPPEPRAAPATPEAEAPPGEREECARRLFFIAWFGLVLPPVAFVALYFLLNGAFGPGELSPRGRFNLFVGGVLVAAGLSLFTLLCAGFGGAFR